MAAARPLLCLLCAAALAAAAAAPPGPPARARHEANRLQAMRFRCKEPQPRAVLSAPLVRAAPSEHVDPPYTVLHRCDGGAGCCASNTVCDVSDLEEVTLAFAVSDRVHGGRSVEFRQVTQTNHTRCHCVEREPQPPK